MISKDTIALVRERADIVALVRESVPTLKKQGAASSGFVPFTRRRRRASREPRCGLYHCFGCKESGDVFTFLERIEGYTFTEAVRALAERGGVAIEEERGADPDRCRPPQEGARSALRRHATSRRAWYEEQLREHPQRRYALDELARRELSIRRASRCSAFRVGYAPPGWDGLAAFLKKQGVSPALAETVGLIVPRSGGLDTTTAFGIA